jgi:N-[(2S)-2-amino-2-carboxyethyl]-L-glutamate dehydrogenase
VDLQLPGERGRRHPEGLGRADPQRPRHRLPLRLPGGLDHQRHQDGGVGTGWSFDEIGVHDLSADNAAGFCGYLERSGAAGPITVHDSAERLLRSSDLVVFATIAGQPHVGDLSWFEHAPLVLHVSLRDLAPEIVLASTNIVDDVEHCLKADTSPHLAEQLAGNREFLHGTLDDVIAGRVTLPADRPLVFSPFGLGVLDLAVGRYVYDEVARSGELRVVDDFFHELRRYG